MARRRRTRTPLDTFHDAAQSLKRYRRAELLSDTGEDIVKTLYEDPLPKQHVLGVMLRPNTTFLIGRKGTGKSTVFQRTQYELRNDRKRYANHLSAYIDIKTVYESSEVNRRLLEQSSRLETDLPDSSLERLLRLKAFIGDLINGIIEELRPVSRNRKLFRELAALLDDARSGENFVRILTVREQEIKRIRGESDGRQASVSVGADGGGPTIGGTLGRSKSVSRHEESTYREILMEDFSIKSYVLKLKALLERIGIRHLYVFVDDFSELPLDAMKLIVDTILAPLNNWSEEFVKFKVACYPGRIYLGDIDQTKIDELNLDIDSLYGATDISKVEEGGTDFVRRLVSTRLAYFGDTTLANYLDTRTRGADIWRLLFLASSGNPRILGNVLFDLYEKELIHSRKVSSAAVENAAQYYYEQKIEADFARRTEFLQMSFDERSSFYSLKELLDGIVSEARGNGSSPGCSHFCVAAEHAGVLETLELNFFMTHYQTTLTATGAKVAVFALNYGLCRKHHIEFGRPRDSDVLHSEYDYTRLLVAHVMSSEEIRCTSCGHVFPRDQLESIRFFHMRCRDCGGVCELRNRRELFEPLIDAKDDADLLPPVELGILSSLASTRQGLRPKEIAAELDCTYQLVSRRGAALRDRELVEFERGQPLKITNLALQRYFRAAA